MTYLLLLEPCHLRSLLPVLLRLSEGLTLLCLLHLIEECLLLGVLLSGRWLPLMGDNLIVDLWLGGSHLLLLGRWVLDDPAPHSVEVAGRAVLPPTSVRLPRLRNRLLLLLHPRLLLLPARNHNLRLRLTPPLHFLTRLTQRNLRLLFPILSQFKCYNCCFQLR